MCVERRYVLRVRKMEVQERGKWSWGEACPHCGKTGAKLDCLTGGKYPNRQRKTDQQVQKLQGRRTWRVGCRGCGQHIRDVKEQAVLQRYGREVVEYLRVGRTLPI
jgi:hypothetical protein